MCSLQLGLFATACNLKALTGRDGAAHFHLSLHFLHWSFCLQRYSLCFVQWFPLQLLSFGQLLHVLPLCSSLPSCVQLIWESVVLWRSSVVPSHCSLILCKALLYLGSVEQLEGSSDNAGGSKTNISSIPSILTF